MVGGKEGWRERVGRTEGEFLAFHDPHPPAMVQHLLPPLGGGKRGRRGGRREPWEVVKRGGRAI